MSRLSIVRLLILGAIALTDAAPAAASPCAAKFGDVVDFDECNPASLPGLEVKFLGITNPDESIPMSCWNYEASVGVEAVETFQQCHTGELGGYSALSVGGKDFTVVFDVSAGCARLPNGSWAPRVRGHAFYRGVMELYALEKLWNKQSDRELRCFARKRPN